MTMMQCSYFYCRAFLPLGTQACPHCGYPIDETMLRDPSYLNALRRRVPVESLVDMHQILRNEPGEVERQLAAMKLLGIKRVLLQSAPAEFTGLLGNGRLEAVAAGHPGLFWVSRYIDPHEPGALAALDQIAAEGIRVVKLVPAAGFAANDPALAPFWSAMESHRLVAMVHTGFVTARHKSVERKLGRYMDSQLSHPFLFDLVARRHPALQIILCHLGGVSWYKEAAQMVSEHDNVWGDTSAFGAFALRRCLVESVPLAMDKVFWGNDASAKAYLFNLHLLVDVLERAGMSQSADDLLCRNGERFAADHLDA